MIDITTADTSNITCALKGKNVHMIGIGGSGMYPLAQILKSLGYAISGSDVSESATTKTLADDGVKVYIGHDGKQVAGADAVVYSAAISQDNPEIIEAKRRGIATLERSELLGIVADSFSKAIAVCGTHGKTTSTAMLTEVLIAAGFDPSAVIGGKLASIGGSGRVGTTDFMVCEACEFNNTYHAIHPWMSLVLNVDEDHLEFFVNIGNIIRSFSFFAAQTTGFVVANGDDTYTLAAVRNCGRQLVLFGTDEECRFRAQNIAEAAGYFEYDFYDDGVFAGRVALSVPGMHNVSNSLGVLACAVLAGVDAKTAVAAVSKFSGTGRRFEKIGVFGGVTVIDDYAHNPTEIKAVLGMARKMNYGNIIAVFQPVTFSRTKLMLSELAEALGMADKCVLTPILGSREINTYGIDSADLAAEIGGAVNTDGFESAAEAVAAAAKDGDLVLTLGCGDIYKALPFITEKLG